MSIETHLVGSVDDESTRCGKAVIGGMHVTTDQRLVTCRIAGCAVIGTASILANVEWKLVPTELAREIVEKLEPYMRKTAVGVSTGKSEED